MTRLIPPRHLSNTLIARSKKHDDQQRNEEREGACDAPLGEDDTEVLGGPCEEHLLSAPPLLAYATTTITITTHIRSIYAEANSRSCYTVLRPYPYRRVRRVPCPCPGGGGPS